jgi:hypothetical protein
MRGGDKWFPGFACLDLRSHRERGSLLPVEIPHTRTNVAGRNTVRGYRLYSGDEGHHTQTRLVRAPTADFNRSFEFQEDWLIYKDLACPGAEILDLILLQLDRLSRSIATD